MSDRISLTQWADYWATPGTVLSLAWLAPPSNRCERDLDTYRTIIARSGIASGAEGTLWRVATMGGRLSADHARQLLVLVSPLIDRYRVSTGAPRNGYRRLGQVLDTWVIVSRGGRLGELLPARIACSPGNFYELKAVHVLRRGQTNLDAIAAARQEGREQFARRLEADGVLGVVGDAAADILGEAVSALLRGLAPLAIPLAVGLVIYASVKGK